MSLGFGELGDKPKKKKQMMNPDETLTKQRFRHQVQLQYKLEEILLDDTQLVTSINLLLGSTVALVQ